MGPLPLPNFICLHIASGAQAMVLKGAEELKNLVDSEFQMLCDERVISSCEEGTAGREVKAEKS
jgi:hypothetical protein